MPYKMNMRNGRALEEHDVLHYGDTKRFTQFRKLTFTYDDIEEIHCNSCSTDIFLGKDESRICPNPQCNANL